MIKNKDQIFGKINFLRKNNCINSAETLASIFLSSIKKNANDERSSLFLSETYEILADIAFEKMEYKRAQIFYQISNQQRKLFSNKVRASKIDSAIEADLKYRECLCFIKLKDHSSALRELELIPFNLRDIQINICLGRLYKSANMRRHAITAFKSALSISIFAIEAIESLIDIGADSDEILQIIEKTSNESGQCEFIFDGWLLNLVSGLLSKRNGNYLKCENHFRKIKDVYSNNVFLLNHMAKAALDVGKIDEAYSLFKSIRKIDPLEINNMDRYAKVLMLKHEENELNRLSHDLMSIDKGHPATWLTVAAYCHLKEEHEKSLLFVDKAIALDTQYPPSHILRGELLLPHQPELALAAFHQAHALRRDVASFIGIVSANTALKNNSHALNAAQEAVQLFPQCSDAHVARGTALQQSGAHAEAATALSHALSLDPDHLAAASALLTALMDQRRYSEAADRAQQLLGRAAHCSRVQFRVVFAQALAALNRLPEALEQLRLAAGLAAVQGQDEAAVATELDRIEDLLRRGGEEEEVLGSSLIDDEEDSFSMRRPETPPRTRRGRR